MRLRLLVASLSVIVASVALLAWIVGASNANPFATMTLSGEPKANEFPQVAQLQRSEGPQSGLQSGKKPLQSKQIQDAWQDLEAASKEVGGNPWVLIVDADTGETIFERDSDVAHAPASTMKVLTAAFILSQGDATNTLTTGINQDGTQLYLWGEGDLLLAEKRGKSSAQNGRAGIQDLTEKAAETLKKEEITKVTLNYQNTLLPGPRKSEAWTKQDVAEYAGKTGVFAVDSGRINKSENYYVPEPEQEVAELVAKNLEKKGIKVETIKTWDPTADSQETGKQAPGKTIATVESAPLIEQVEYMLAVSDNTTAQQFCQLAASHTLGEPASFDQANEELHKFLENQDISTEGLSIKDCSGLDDRSQVSARTLVETLQTMSATNGIESQLPRLLPVSGYTGTMVGRVPHENTTGNVVAKTGSLGSVTSLTGTLTTHSGQNLVFAIGVDNIEDDQAYTLTYWVDQFLIDITQN